MLATLDGATCNALSCLDLEGQEEAGMCYSICKKMGESWLDSMQRSGKSDSHPFFYTMVLRVV